MENLRNIIEKSILDEIDNTINIGDEISKYYPLFNAIHENDKKNNRYFKSKDSSRPDEDLLGNKIEVGDLLYCLEYTWTLGHSAGPTGPYCIAVGYKDHDDINKYNSGLLCVIFGFKNRSSKDKISKNLPKNFENLKSNKEIVKTFGAKSNRFIIVKKGTHDMKKYIEELNIELQ